MFCSFLPRGTFSMFVLVLGDNLVGSWSRSRILGHVVCVSMLNREGGTANRLQSMLGWPCLVLSWNLEDPGHVFPKSADLEIHPSETNGSWMQFFINRRLYGLFEPGDWMDFHPGTRRLDGLSFLEPGSWMDFRPGTRRLEPDGRVDLQGDLLVYLFDSKSPPSGRLSLIARYAFWRSVFLYQNLGASSSASSSYPWEDLQMQPDLLGS
ncbi:LOW QUALITY PROTEIN: hypothetical protein HID58_055372 [Brassica napus]|uniref:Uncharacterized protein n=1 Tax=Brassica napus TaxID=3708 RepID=A0ABQ8AL45_BRANA|nr:LOW QUALITY PROTEIN: hypothetical protein HID58_055372 [Brassica napus]